MPKGIKYRRAYQRMAAFVHARDPKRNVIRVRLGAHDLARVRQLARRMTKGKLSPLLRLALSRLIKEESL